MFIFLLREIFYHPPASVNTAIHGVRIFGLHNMHAIFTEPGSVHCEVKLEDEEDISLNKIYKESKYINNIIYKLRSKSVGPVGLNHSKLNTNEDHQLRLCAQMATEYLDFFFF